jgi:hypothetical protein
VANYAPRRTTYDTVDRRWLPDMLKAETHGVSLDADRFLAKWADGNVPSGAVTAIDGTSGLAVPYDPAYDSDPATAGAQPNGADVADGHLVNNVKVAAGERHHVAVVHAGTVDRRFLPATSGLDAGAEADLTTIAYIR